jgi:hypothetical protein
VEEPPAEVADLVRHISVEVLRPQATVGNAAVPFEAVVLRRRDLEGPLPTVGGTGA